MSSPDRIEKQILLRAPKSRVWQALTDARQFGEWFRVRLEGQFAPGRRITGKMTYPGYEGWPFDAMVERMDAESYFSMRWAPQVQDREVDYDKDPTTLVEFRLDEVPEGTRLTTVESGFENIPAALRDKVFRGNDEGWSIQTQNIKAYVQG